MLGLRERERSVTQMVQFGVGAKSTYRAEARAVGHQAIDLVFVSQLGMLSTMLLVFDGHLRKRIN